MRTPARLLLALVIGLVVTACAGVSDPGAGNGDRGSGGTSGGGGGGSAGVGPGISIDEATDSTLDGPLLVNGFIVAEEGGEVRLCSALRESYPPQCGGAWLLVEGLDLTDVEGLTSAQGVSWTDGETQLLGTVEDGVLTVETGAQ